MTHRTIRWCAFGFVVSATLTGCSGLVETCVVEGTAVSTPSGAVPIESLRVGDEVLSQSEGGDFRVGVVGTITKGTASELCQLTLSDGTVLTTTPEHLIRCDDRWRRAGELRNGDEVLSADSVLFIARTERVSGRVRVRDLMVTPSHSYFANGVLVHNKTIAVPVKREEVIDTWIGRDSFGYPYAIRLDKDGSGAIAWIRTSREIQIERLAEWTFEAEDPYRSNVQIRYSRQVYDGSQLVDDEVVIHVIPRHHALDLRFVRSGTIEPECRFRRASDEVREVEILRSAVGDNESG